MISPPASSSTIPTPRARAAAARALRSELTAYRPSRGPHRHVEVQMVGVGAIVVGRQHGAEQVARSVAHRMKELAAAVALLPVDDKRHVRFVGQDRKTVV